MKSVTRERQIILILKQWHLEVCFHERFRIFFIGELFKPHEATEKTFFELNPSYNRAKHPTLLIEHVSRWWLFRKMLLFVICVNSLRFSRSSRVMANIWLAQLQHTDHILQDLRVLCQENASMNASVWIFTHQPPSFPTVAPHKAPVWQHKPAD